MQYYNYSTIASNQSLEYNIGNYLAGQEVSVTLSYLIGAGIPSGEHLMAPSAGVEAFSNLDIYICRTNASGVSESLASSTSTRNNVEKIIFQIPEDGGYKIVIQRKSDSVNNTVRFAFAYQLHSSTLP